MDRRGGEKGTADGKNWINTLELNLDTLFILERWARTSDMRPLAWYFDYISQIYPLMKALAVRWVIAPQQREIPFDCGMRHQRLPCGTYHRIYEFLFLTEKLQLTEKSRVAWPTVADLKLQSNKSPASKRGSIIVSINTCYRLLNNFWSFWTIWINKSASWTLADKQMAM